MFSTCIVAGTLTRQRLAVICASNNYRFFSTNRTQGAHGVHGFQTYGEDARAREFKVDMGQRQVFKPKETYMPRDLNDRNLEMYTKKLDLPPSEDILKKLGIDPIKEYRNVNMLSHFITAIGHIKPRHKTGLTLENQRRVSRAIKRARAMGLMPYTYSILQTK
ncbi:hypothetical protein O5D80_006091 [Batrachochytrium dendrobatidis]|nr:hypothetical protein O5D80_006091 [Batrachochytrium dendrobatidis]